jgi:sodium pump decarboxylase gamma subunit
MEHLSIMERFADPQYFETLTMGEKAIGGGITTLMGMGVTFTILILLAGLIVIMARLLNKKEKTPKGGTPVSATEVKAPPQAGAMAQTGDASQGDLIAVIMAAIAAFEGSSVTSNLVVRKINRVAGPALAWNTAGQQDCIASRKI